MKEKGKLEGTFERIMGPREFMCNGALHAVSQFIACDDQVRIHDLEDLVEVY